MPIRINLLEEEQKQKLARKRDPIMLAIRLSVLWVILVLSVSVVLYTRQRAAKEHLNGLKAEWKQREGKFVKTEAEIKDLTKVESKIDLMRFQIKSRFLWAPQLELFKDVIPSTIQITRFVGNREVVTPAPSVGGTKAAPPSPTEMVKVTLEGIAEGSRPELLVNDFLNKLKADQKLAQHVDDVRLISLTRGGPSQNRTDVESAFEVTSARFVIEIQYKQRPIKQA